jgi:glutaconate CoA-transferase subunit A
MTMQEAVSKFVNDGDHIVFGGFVTNRRPYAAVHEIIRQGKKDLVLESSAGAGGEDVLIGAGCVRILLESYMANSGYNMVARRMRKAIETKAVIYDDYSLDMHPIQYHAAAMGIPFIPVKNMLGSDIADKWGIPEEVWKSEPKLPNAKFIRMDNPFNPGEKLLLMPAAPIDVGFIHVQYAAPDGTFRIEGSTFVDEDIAMGATNCIVCCEKIVHPDYLRDEPWRNHAPNLVAAAVVEVPYGAHPSQCTNFYDYDGLFMRDYDKASADDALFDEFVNTYIKGTKDHNEYLDKLGASRLLNLAVKPGWGYVPGLKRK